MRYRRSRWWRGHGTEFRQGTAYRKNVNHKKKIKEWTPRECWREIKKPKSRKQHWGSGRRKKHCITLDHRRHRRLSKREIHHERWDGLFDKLWLLINDPWNWD